MKLAKSLLLGSASAFVAVAGAAAADLPARKAAPVEYVRVCNAYGAGFYVIPGTDTCIKVGGRVRADYAFAGRKDVYTASSTTLAANASSENLWGNEVRGRLDLDARTPTAWGTVQAVVSTRVGKTAGVLTSSTATSSNPSASPQLEAAYIRFAGFTFGVAKDNFSFMPSTFYGTGHWSSFANGAFQLAYTAVLGGGLSATIAIQDQSYTAQGSGLSSGTGLTSSIQNSYDRFPQVNARLDWDQSWGTVSVMGATTQLHNVTSATSNAYDASKTAWALGAGVKINLPMLASGDALWLNGGYADGMTEYTVNWISFKSSDIARNVGGYVQDAKSYATTANGIETFKSWNIAALFTHFWTPQWRHSVLATYGAVDAPSSVNALTWGTTVGGQADAKVWNVGTQLAFLPVNNFEIGVDVLYARVRYQNSATTAVNTSQGNWTGRLRVERTF